MPAGMLLLSYDAQWTWGKKGQRSVVWLWCVSVVIHISLDAVVTVLLCINI